MCGVHNCTQEMNVRDLWTFAMIGTSGRQYVTINMPAPTNSSPPYFSLSNVSNATMKDISVSHISARFFGDSKFNAINTNFYADYKNYASQYVPAIDFSTASALFDSCTFQQNSFLFFDGNSNVTVHSCIFHSYNHGVYSPIRGKHSTLNLSGSVYFFNNTVSNLTNEYAMCGGPLYMAYSHLNVNDGAYVHFINNTADCGGAIFLERVVMNIANEVNMYFLENKTRKQRHVHSYKYKFGGAAILLHDSFINTTNAKLHFNRNSAGLDGGAILMHYQSKMKLSSNTLFNFTSNVATGTGGAIQMLRQSIIHITCDTVVHFQNNRALIGGGAISLFDGSIFNTSSNTFACFRNNTAINREGGALSIASSYLFIQNSTLFIENNSATKYAGGGIFMSSSSLSVTKNSEVFFTANQAPLQGGAVLSLGSNISIDSSSLMITNNSANQGGALYLTASATLSIGSDSVVLFGYNTAADRGGAVYINTIIELSLPCFLVLTNYSSMVIFEGNIAKSEIGMDVYGASIRSSACAKNSKQMGTCPYCGTDVANIIFIPSNHNMQNSSLSSVSSGPKRVCLCDSDGYPQCANISEIFVNGLTFYSGEYFNLSLVVVGHDFGISVGAIFANFIYQTGHSPSKLNHYQYHQWFGNTQCSNMTYTIISNNSYEILYLQTLNVVSTYGDQLETSNLIDTYNSNSHHGCLDPDLLTTTVFVNISILPGCPQGFKFDKDFGCSCFQVLSDNKFQCFIENNKGYLKWNSTMWVNAINGTIVVSQHCPLGYCLSGEKRVDFASDLNTQCDFNHAGILCGGCKDHYSLAIGSSKCIQCSSNVYMSLFLFFLAAGIILVILILTLNLTVTQGLINGPILYANLLWTYKDILFPSELHSVTFVVHIFIAWLNLDFGIETCLVVGLTPFWKTWFQFLFPLYIWFIAGVIIIGCRYSSCLTHLFGDRAVPLLSTLFLLSYTKLLRTTMMALEFGELNIYPHDDGSKMVVWYLDGNLSYCKHPHIYLFIIAVTTLILCLSFTLFLLLIQSWRKISHLMLLRWINRFTPFYDAYFAPLKDKHHYWFGTLLLVRIAILVSFTATSSTFPLLSLLILLLTSLVLLFYTSIKHVYKSKIVRIFENTSLLNLIILIVFMQYTGGGGTIFLEISIVFAFLQFMVIIIISLIKIIFKTRHKRMSRKGYNLIRQNSDSSDEIVH